MTNFEPTEEQRRRAELWAGRTWIAILLLLFFAIHPLGYLLWIGFRSLLGF